MVCSCVYRQPQTSQYGFLCSFSAGEKLRRGKRTEEKIERKKKTEKRERERERERESRERGGGGGEN